VLVAPPGTSADAVKKISDDLNAVLARAEVRQKLNALGVSTRQMSPQQLSEFIHREQELWNPVVKQIGIAAQ
jgi:tripartite-type tricarboxylate transporter receptor subunit TctC